MGNVVLAMVTAAADRGSLSDELHFAAKDRAEREQLDHGCANVLRALTLPPAATVLVHTGGNSAPARYLAEQAASVHAVNADTVSAARLDGCEHVLLADSLEQLPATRYDVVILTAKTTTRRALELGASSVITADNPVERREVELALHNAGIPLTHVLTAAPDHRIARAVFTSEFATEFPRLAQALAPAREHGFVLLAGAEGLWPSERLATYFNTAERAAFACTRADVVRVPGGAEVRRTPLLPGAKPIAGISIRAYTDVVHDAPTILAVLLEEPWRANELLTRWRELLRKQASGTWDLVPHNVLVDGEQLRPIDLEWMHEHASETDVVERGVLVLADQLAAAGWPGAAAGSSMRELAGWLGVLLGLDPSFVDGAADREAVFATVASCGAAEGTEEIRVAIRAVWERRMERRADLGDLAEANLRADEPGYRSPGSQPARTR